MVKKLMKYEFGYYFRRMLPLYLVSLGLAVLNRGIQFFEADSTPYRITFYSSVAAMIVFSIALVVMTQIFIVVRFYSNLFKNEGYLTMTLPVSTTTHLNTKLLCAMIIELITYAILMLSVTIATFYDVYAELWKAFLYITDFIYKQVGGHLIPYILLFIILLLVTTAAKDLVYYLCLSVGQLAKRSRIAQAIGMFIAIYFASQILGTILMIVLSTMAVNGMLDNLLIYLTAHPHFTGYMVLIVPTIITGIAGLVCYLITGHILKNKLNIE